mgnify:CR=1 FL=1
MRIVLYTGKGGVGKTSVAAATAVRAAEAGHRTIVLSTDAAHSLADSFDRRLAPEPVEVAPHLWAQELDVLHQIDRYWGTIEEWLKALAVWQGLDQIVADEIAVLPGMEELASLLQIVYLHDSGLYDFIIVDCAPTGETLRLLSFPEVARWWLEKVFPLQRRAAQFWRPVVRTFIDMPLPTDEVFASVQTLFGDLERMRVLLANPELSSVRLVVNPEKMVIKEAQRTFTYLNLFDYATDAVVVNRVMAAGPQLEGFDLDRLNEALRAQAGAGSVVDDVHKALHYWYSWSQMQRPYLDLIDDSFAPVPILHCPFFANEVVGLDMLRRMADAIYGDRDPTTVFYRGLSQSLEKANGTYTLTVPLPLVAKGDVDLTRAGDEMVVRIGNHRRNLILPRTLVGLEAKEAKLEEGVLRIVFSAEDRYDED